MTEKIAMLVDSGMDMPVESINKGGVFIVPLNIMYHDKTYMDKIEISAEEIYNRLEEEIPKTSLPSPKYVNETIEKIKAEGYTKIMLVSISSGLSGTHNALRLILEDHPDIESAIVDTKSIGIGGGILAAHIKDLIEQGTPWDELERITQTLPEQGNIYFSIPTLEYLKKGGRIGLVTSILGTALNLNPIISCNEDGIYYTVSKARGRKKSLSKMIDIAVKAVGDSRSYSFGVAFGTSKDEAELVLEELKKRLPHYKHAYFDEVSPVLGAHTGPGVIGVGVIRLND